MKSSAQNDKIGKPSRNHINKEPIFQERPKKPHRKVVNLRLPIPNRNIDCLASKTSPTAPEHSNVTGSNLRTASIPYPNAARWPTSRTNTLILWWQVAIHVTSIGSSIPHDRVAIGFWVMQWILVCGRERSMHAVIAAIACRAWPGTLSERTILMAVVEDLAVVTLT